jgi:EAL domain-containing protein (putative c-di-GMP-specific phosphodiesterase class I)
MLRQLGCTEMQGFLFSPARPGAEIMPMLRSRRQRMAGAA